MSFNRKAWALAALPLWATLPVLAACAGRTDRTGEDGREPAANTAGAAAVATEATPAPGTGAPAPATDEQSPTPTPAPAASEAEVPRVPVAEARALYDSGAAVFVDVRDLASYGSSHIAGARPIPLFQVASRADELPRDKRIITYCS